MLLRKMCTCIFVYMSTYLWARDVSRCMFSEASSRYQLQRELLCGMCWEHKAETPSEPYSLYLMQKVL